MATLPPMAPLCPPHHWLIEEALRIQHWACYRCHTTREVPQEHSKGAGWFASSRLRPTRTGASPPITMPAG